MTDDDKAGEQSPATPPAVEIREADGTIVFRAECPPPRFKQFDAEAQARIVDAVGLPLAASASHHDWLGTFISLTQIAHAIEPPPEPFKRSDWERMQKLARELKRLAAHYVREDPAGGEQSPLFQTIGIMHVLEEWARGPASQPKRPRGQPRPQSLDRNLQDLRHAFVVLFGADPDDSPKSPFTRFVQAALKESAGINIGDDWLRDKRRKRGKLSPRK